MKCENDLPCGNELLHRYSAYNTGYGPGGSGVFPSIPSATSSISPSPTTINGTQPPTEPPASAIISNPKQNNTAMIIALSASAGVAVVGAVAFAVHRLRKRRELHTLPRLTAGVDRKMSSLGQNLTTSQHTIRPSASASQIAVISLNGFQGMLPLTPNMIYSVTVAYTPSGEQLDEIHVKKDDVVAIQRHFDDGWAIGTNVSTGETGAFPLGCLVMDEAWILAGFVPPVRLRSIRESNGNVGNLDVVAARSAEGP
ncbi:hypothetical protein HDU85_004205 [Gaertneriomyces sp. JEL0708]|nr:hypothetical protein HDU85_004205 [Gaertneriomyces sp. JEL0708]